MSSKRRVNLPIVTVDRVQERALVGSITHWVRMRDGTRKSNEWITSESCMCCREFRCGRHCEGCPISQFSGTDMCNHTPWQNACDSITVYGIDSPEFHAAAAKEVEFLRGVLRWVREGKPSCS